MIRVIGLEESDPSWAKLNSITERLSKKDHSLWGVSAATEAAIRLDWIDLPESSRELLPQLDALTAWSREMGHLHFVLCGMGGSSLAPEVIAASYKKKLTILDSTDPHQILGSLPDDLSSSCFIIASKSGSTIETTSQQALVEYYLRENDLDPRNHMVVITDPGSPLDQRARESGLKVINANPKVGGRFSALSAFGLTPAALIGVDVSLLLDDAASAASEFVKENSSVVRMAAFLAKPQNAFPTFFDGDSLIPGISDWIEQLVAESTGKDGKGVLPVVVETAEDSLISFNGHSGISVLGPLGAHFIFWEWVTALLCYLIDVDPFNQPNVAESKERTGKILLSEGLADSPRFSTENLDFYCSTDSVDGREALAKSLPAGYIAIMSYLDRLVDKDLLELRAIISEKSGRPTTFGWGPRFLHSTGQFHKGGPLVGSFIQITGACNQDVDIPGVGFGFARLISAQAAGDREALASRSLPVLRIHLKNRREGIRELLALAKSL